MFRINRQNFNFHFSLDWYFELPILGIYFAHKLVETVQHGHASAEERSRSIERILKQLNARRSHVLKTARTNSLSFLCTCEIVNPGVSVNTSGTRSIIASIQNIKVLIDAGAQINPVLRTSRNVFMTPLDCALQKGFRSTAKFLQLHGGIPAVRLADPRTQINPLELNHDVTNWGDISSESEGEDKDVERLKKSYRKKISHREHRTEVTVSNSEKQIQTQSSLSNLNDKILSNEIFDIPVQQVTETLEVTPTITSQKNVTGQSQDTSEGIINNVNDNHSNGCNNVTNSPRKESTQEREKRPRSAKYSKFKVTKEPSNSENEGVFHTENGKTDLNGDGGKDISALNMESDLNMKENSSSIQQVPQEEKLRIDDTDLKIHSEATTASFSNDEVLGTNERRDLLVEAAVHPLPSKFTMEDEQISSDRNESGNGTKSKDDQGETVMEMNNIDNTKSETNIELETPSEMKSYETCEEKTATNIPVGISEGTLESESSSAQKEQKIENVGVSANEVDEIVDSENLSPITSKGDIDDDSHKKECQDSKSQTEEILEENDEGAQNDKEIVLIQPTDNENMKVSGNEERSVSNQFEKQEKIENDNEDVLTSYDEDITENEQSGEKIVEFNGVTDETHKSFKVLKENEFEKIEKIEKTTQKRPRKRVSTKKSRSHSDETKENNHHPKQKRVPDKISRPMFQNKLSRSDKYLDKTYECTTPESKLDERISSLPNIHYDKRIPKENVRCESNLPAPLVYSDNERDSLTDPEDFQRKMSKNKRFVKKKSRNRVARSAGSDYESSNLIDSGFEPSPRTTKIPRWKNMSERGVNMTSVTQTIQSNIRRYHLERKIFFHLLELKRHQIRAGQHNEAILVKRAIDDYHKSCISTVGAGRYIPQDFTFKSFEKFLYEALRKLQKNGPDYIKGLPEPPSNPLLCTRSTNRCMHAAHAYTGVPCAAYLPKMDHHSIPKIGFNNIDCKPTSRFLPIIQKKGVTVELTQGSEKQIISLPTDRLDQNKRYYVTFTVRGHELPAPEDKNQESQALHRHARSD